MSSRLTTDLRISDQARLENVKAYWNRRPCNIGHSKRPLATKEYFDEVEARRYFVEPHIPGFAQFERWRNTKVLEVGCGIGTDAVNFARAGALYTGVELSQASLDLAMKRFDVFGLKGNFVLCDAEHLSHFFSLDTFDLVYAFGIIHHTPNQRAATEEIRKVIKKDGEFRCMLYAKNSWKRIMIDAGLDQPEAQAGCPIATVYSPEMIKALFSGLFELVSAEQAHIFPYVIDKYVRFEYEVQPWFREMPREMFQALERNLGWHHLLVARPQTDN